MIYYSIITLAAFFVCYLFVGFLYPKNCTVLQSEPYQPSVLLFKYSSIRDAGFETLTLVLTQIFCYVFLEAPCPYQGVSCWRSVWLYYCSSLTRATCSQVPFFCLPALRYLFVCLPALRYLFVCLPALRYLLFAFMLSGTRTCCLPN